MSPEEVVRDVVNLASKDLIKKFASDGVEVLFYSIYLDIFEVEKKLEHRLVLRIVDKNKVWLIRVTEKLDTGEYEYEVWEGDFKPLITDLLCNDYVNELKELVEAFEGELIGESKR